MAEEKKKKRRRRRKKTTKPSRLARFFGIGLGKRAVAGANGSARAVIDVKGGELAGHAHGIGGTLLGSAAEVAFERGSTGEALASSFADSSMACETNAITHKGLKKLEAKKAAEREAAENKAREAAQKEAAVVRGEAEQRTAALEELLEQVRQDRERMSAQLDRYNTVFEEMMKQEPERAQAAAQRAKLMN